MGLGQTGNYEFFILSARHFFSSLSLSDSDGDWDFNWCDGAWLRKYFDHSYMEEHVRINHFHNNYEVSGIISYNYMITGCHLPTKL